MRTGAAYLASLADGREVVSGGELVRDVASHPGFAGICRSLAGLYDRIAAPGSGMTFPSPATGRPVFAAHRIPRTREELAERRAALTRSAEASYGLIGRGPEHVAGFFAGFAGVPEFFAVEGHAFDKNVAAYQQRIRDEHLHVAYTIVPPQVDRSKTASEQGESHHPVKVIQERDDGIVVRGAQMLGTAAAVADELFLSCIVPLKPGDEDFALSLAAPIAAPGLRLYTRRAYAVGQPSVFDYPLSTRFDEGDAFVVFRDVFVPWERVFVFRDLARTRGQFFQTPAHVLGNSQAQVRLGVKVKFLLGLAHRIAEINGVLKLPATQALLGELAGLVSLVEGMTLAAEQSAVTHASGVVHPNPRFLYGIMALQAELYPRMVQMVRELSGGGMLQVPSSVKDYGDPEIAEDLRRHLVGANVGSEQRVKLFKLAWEMVGSEFAGRHQQYEMFYAGSPQVAKTYAFLNYGFEEALSLVDDCLAGYGMESV
ncbi:MAG: hypothetical protein IT442_07935 [Phycisphaeraceae bacterium]|nr:hypothetical protein [Phycisphaeraceae bacterium]